MSSFALKIAEIRYGILEGKQLYSTSTKQQNYKVRPGPDWVTTAEWKRNAPSERRLSRSRFKNWSGICLSAWEAQIPHKRRDVVFVSETPVIQNPSQWDCAQPWNCTLQEMSAVTGGTTAAALTPTSMRPIGAAFQSMSAQFGEIFLFCLFLGCTTAFRMFSAACEHFKTDLIEQIWDPFTQ